MKLPFLFSTAVLQTLPSTANPLDDGISVPRDIRFTGAKYLSWQSGSALCLNQISFI